MPQARVTWPDARVMADGRVRIPDLGTLITPATGPAYTEFSGPGWEIEAIPVPEPRWDPGAIVVDAAGEHFVRTPAGRWQHVLDLTITPTRPLTLMVPAP